MITPRSTAACWARVAKIRRPDRRQPYPYGNCAGHAYHHVGQLIYLSKEWASDSTA